MATRSSLKAREFRNSTRSRSIDRSNSSRSSQNNKAVNDSSERGEKSKALESTKLNPEEKSSIIGNATSGRQIQTVATNLSVDSESINIMLKKQHKIRDVATSPLESNRSDGYFLYPNPKRRSRSLVSKKSEESIKSSSTARSSRKLSVYHRGRSSTINAESMGDSSTAVGSSSSPKNRKKKLTESEQGQKSNTSSNNNKNRRNRFARRTGRSLSLTRSLSEDPKSPTIKLRPPKTYTSTKTLPMKSNSNLDVFTESEKKVEGNGTKEMQSTMSTDKDNNNQQRASRYISSRRRARSLSRTRSSSLNSSHLEECPTSSKAGITGRSPFSQIMADKLARVNKTRSKEKISKLLSTASSSQSGTEKNLIEPQSLVHHRFHASHNNDDNRSPNRNEVTAKQVDDCDNNDKPAVDDNARTEEVTYKDNGLTEEYKSENHLAVNDEYGDPPLEEIESEISIGHNIRSIGGYLSSESIFASFSASPKQEVVSKNDNFFPADLNSEHNDETRGEEKETATNFAETPENTRNNNDDSSTIWAEFKNSSWDLSALRFSDIAASSSQADALEMFDTASWAAGSANVSPSKFPVDKKSELHFINLMMEEKKNRDLTENEGKMLEKAQKYLTQRDDIDQAGTIDQKVEPYIQSNTEMNIDCESHFIRMMTEEMRTRTLTDNERDALFEAREKIALAEEQIKAELNIVQKDDEPLFGNSSTSDDAITTGSNTSLKDRLEIYTSQEPDEESVDDDSEDKSQNEEARFDDDEVEINVDYIGQHNESEDEDREVNGKELFFPFLERRVSSNDIPNFEVATAAAAVLQNSEDMNIDHACQTHCCEDRKQTRIMMNLTSDEDFVFPATATSSHQKKFIDDSFECDNLNPNQNDEKNESVVLKVTPLATLESLKMSVPPPPPPGAPTRRKTKKKKSTSSCSRDKSIPLIVPPPPEKLKNWEDNQKKARECVAKLKENFVKVEPKAFEISHEYFNFHSCNENCDDESFETENKVGEKMREFNAQPNDATKVSLESDIPSLYDAGLHQKKECNSVSKVDFNQKVLHTENQEVPLPCALTKGTEYETNNQCRKHEIALSVSPTSRTTLTIEEVQNIQGPGDANAHIASFMSAPKNILWQKEVADAIGLVERLEEKYDQDFAGIDSFLSPLSDEMKIDSFDDRGVRESEETANETPNNFAGGVRETAGNVSIEMKGGNKKSNDETEPSINADVFFSPERSNRLVKQEKLHDENVYQRNNTEGMIKGMLHEYERTDETALPSSAIPEKFEKESYPNKKSKAKCEICPPVEFDALSWFSREVLNDSPAQIEEKDVSLVARSLLKTKDQFNAMSRFVAKSVNAVSLELKPSLRFGDSTLSSSDKTTVGMTSANSSSTDNTVDDSSKNRQRPLLKPVILSEASVKLNIKVLAANFVSFVYMASKNTNVPSPFGDSNPFLAMIVSSSILSKASEKDTEENMQELIFDQLDGKAELLVDFVYRVKCSCDVEIRASRKSIIGPSGYLSNDGEESDPVIIAEKCLGRHSKVTQSHPSPFEETVSILPGIIKSFLAFLGDPVSVCRMKSVNRVCGRVVAENEHMLMQDAVRTGGIDPTIRPAFWLWITLEKCDICNREKQFNGQHELCELERTAEEGKWHHVIHRDVVRSFGNMPPHKNCAKLRSDSIVTALVSWGHNSIMKRRLKGGEGDNSIGSHSWRCHQKLGDGDDLLKNSEITETPIDTVSALSEVTPKSTLEKEVEYSGDISEDIEIALCGNSLPIDVKKDLQDRLNFILHTLAATYDDIGYCQGMDYVVAHLLRILQETIRWKAANKKLPSVITTASTYQTNIPVHADNIEDIYKEIDSTRIVEESLVRVMDVFFVNYNLKHMYWPELRCLKTCCRVFEKLIQIKLPVLADHFEHHDLNIGLFALGWFQTLFLYLPSMPSETVCRMWDIWLVERSFKIFFRVGTALLFLSQPTLLNHELEGMMIYLNAIPDATLLDPDILINTALNIKVTNRLLQELENKIQAK